MERDVMKSKFSEKKLMLTATVKKTTVNISCSLEIRSLHKVTENLCS